MSKKSCTVTVHETAYRGGRFAYAERMNEEPPDLRVSVESPYDELFVEAVKSVPFQARDYEPGRRRWWFTPAWLESVKAFALAHFDEVLLVEGKVTTNVRTGQTYAQESLF